jgi:hypothetical protein
MYDAQGMVYGGRGCVVEDICRVLVYIEHIYTNMSMNILFAVCFCCFVTTMHLVTGTVCC